MNFVNKQNCWLAGGLEAIYCFVHYPSNVVNFGFDRVQAFKLGLGLVGDDLSERGFAGAGWSIENQRSDAVGFNCAFKQFAWSKNVSLTGKLVEVPWPHPGGKGLFFRVAASFRK